MLKRYPESWYEQRETFRAFVGAVAVVVCMVLWSWLFMVMFG